MCLGIPGRVVNWIDRDGASAQAEVEFEGVRRVCYMACVTEAEIGDFVIVHAGVAICLIDTDEAQQLLQELSQLEDHASGIEASEKGRFADSESQDSSNGGRE